MKSNRFHRKQWKKYQKLKRNRILYYFVIILFLFSVAGCGGGAPSPPGRTKGKEPLKEPLTEQQKIDSTKGVEKKELEKKEEVEYTYNPVGKPDPFKPFIQLTRGPSSGPLTPLQKYEISQLKLVAIISSSEGNVGLIEDSAGKGYFLKKGTVIGKNDGKVTKILKDKVIIEEVYQDIFGHKKTQEISLFLYRQEEEGGS